MAAAIATRTADCHGRKLGGKGAAVVSELVIEQDGTEHGLRAGWLDAAGTTPAVVCQLPDGCCLRMSPSAYWLFGEIGKGLGDAEIAAEIGTRFGQDIDPDAIGAARAGLLADIDEQGE